MDVQIFREEPQRTGYYVRANTEKAKDWVKENIQLENYLIFFISNNDIEQIVVSILKAGLTASLNGMKMELDDEDYACLIEEVPL